MIGDGGRKDRSDFNSDTLCDYLIKRVSFLMGGARDMLDEVHRVEKV